jgi:hypothetical protein
VDAGHRCREVRRVLATARSDLEDLALRWQQHLQLFCDGLLVALCCSRRDDFQKDFSAVAA